MKIKQIKKMMILGMSVSLIAGAVPIQTLARQNKGVELQGAEAFETEARTDAAEPQTEQPVSVDSPAPYSYRTAPQSYAGEIQTIAGTGEPTVLQGSAGTDYTKSGNKFTILTSNVTLRFEGAQCGEIEVAEGAEAHIVLSGMTQSTIGSITGAGSAVFEKIGNGQAAITGDVSVASLTVNGGTLFPGAAVSSPQVVINGGTIAKEGVSAKRQEGDALRDLQSVSVSGLPENAICTVTDVSYMDGSTAGYTGDVWTGADGRAVLYVDAGAVMNVALTTLSIMEVPGTLTAEQQKYECESGAAAKKSGRAVTSAVKVGAALDSVYGVAQAEAANVVAVTAASGATNLLMPGDPILISDDMSWEDKLTVEQVNLKGESRVVQANRKEIPGKYTYMVSVEVEDEKGFHHTVEGPVIYTVEKAVLTPEIVVNGDKLNGSQKVTKQYDGTTAVPAGICSLKLHGAIEGDTVTGTARFAYNDANVPKATRIVIDSVDLDGNWGAYYTCSTDVQDIVYGEITKAPCPRAPQKIKKAEVEVTHNKVKFQGIAGQEYAYSAEGKSRNEWTALKSNTTCTISNASSDTTYTLYTRIAATDNYEASEEVTTDVETTREPYTASASDVSISGITDNSSYTVGTKLTLTAKGVKPEDDDYSEGDERYVPYSWKLKKETVWKKAPYTAQITPDKEGTYTVVVKFHKQVYDGTKWVRAKKGDTKKSVTFKATASSSSSSGSTSSSSGSSSGVVRSTTAARTGDPTPIVILVVVFAVSGAVIFVALRKKKGHK